MNKTKIDYLTHTWNPIAMRCTPVSEGCAHCWHLAMAKRLAANPKIPKELRQAYAGEVVPMLIESRLDAPLRHKEPAVIGVQFMGDFFHPAVPLAAQMYILRVIGNCPRHTFLILTKRTEQLGMWHYACGWHPYPNLWLGVTAENQERADERIPVLLQIPAAIRFVSLEPLLGPVSLDTVMWREDRHYAPLTGRQYTPPPNRIIQGGKLSWVIVGGETGPGARPLHPDWVRDVRNQCQEARVPFCFKGWGEWAPYNEERDHLWLTERARGLNLSEPKRQHTYIRYLHYSGHDGPVWRESVTMVRVGKKRAGRLLDGREWNEMPERT